MMSSKAAREKWNAEHYRQINISVDKELADSFRALCAEEGISVAGALKSFMKERSGATEGEHRKRPGAEKPSRGNRRKQVAGIIVKLEKIMADEESYLDRIPENLQGSVRAETAAHSVSMFAEAVDALSDAY
jgi:hypothetical protein